MIGMLQDQGNSRNFSSAELSHIRDCGIESTSLTENSFNALMVNHPHLTLQTKPQRKRSLAAPDGPAPVPLVVSLTSGLPEKRRKVATGSSIIPSCSGLLIPLKKASWWKTGGDLPRSIARELALFPRAQTTDGVKHQSTAYVSSDSLPRYNRDATLLQQPQTNKKNVAMITLPPTNVSSFVRQATGTGRQQHQMQHPQAPLQKVDLIHTLKPPSSSFENNAANSPILTLLQQRTPPTSTMLLQEPEQQHTSKQTFDDDASHGEDSSSEDSGALNFRAYQAENWTEKFEELIEFRRQYGHCLVPNAFPVNAALAQWVKRQRYQYKLKLENKRSTMSDERVHALDQIGFVWDSHRAIWDERLQELMDYKQGAGHCNVPSRYNANRQLAIWVKRQRRQYKFYTEGKPSSMTDERIKRLEAVGFEWDLRKRNDDDEC